MLVDFTFSNFRSFKNEASFSMEPLSQNGSNPNTIETGLKKVPQIYRTAGIFGPNASGKSNILTALLFLQFLVEKSSNSVVNDNFPEEFYALSNDGKDKSITFDIRFIVDSNLYEYNLAVYKNIVQKENLYYYPISAEGSAKRNRIFERSIVDGHIIFEKTKDIKLNWIFETLDNRLFLSEIVNNRKCKIKEVLDAYNWLTQTLSLISADKIAQFSSLKQIAEGNGKEIINLVKQADLGIEDIRVKEISLEEALNKVYKERGKVPTSLLQEVAKGNKKTFEVSSYHKTEEGDLREFEFSDCESEGTKRLLSLAGRLMDAISQGKVCVIDELDSRLHPLLVENLVELFNNPEINTHNSQLIFVSHAHYLMDGKHLSRDQIWFTSKALNNGFHSDLYSLSDFKKLTRKNASFYEAYRNGVYGAMPAWGRDND